MEQTMAMKTMACPVNEEQRQQEDEDDHVLPDSTHGPYTRGAARGTRGTGNRGNRGALRGRGRGHGRGAGAAVNMAEWDKADPARQPAEFLPSRTKGLHLPENFEPQNELDFFI